MMKRIILAGIIGFVLHPALTEVHDYFWERQFELCTKQLGPFSERSPLGSRFACVNGSGIIRISEILLWRPRIAEKIWNGE